MIDKSIEGMTQSELEALIDERIQQALAKQSTVQTVTAHDWDDVRQMIESNRWTPPADAKSPLEMLREDRDCAL